MDHLLASSVDPSEVRGHSRFSSDLTDQPLVVVLMFFSEKFMVRLNKNGGPKNPEKAERLCALFTVGNQAGRSSAPCWSADGFCVL